MLSSNYSLLFQIHWNQLFSVEFTCKWWIYRKIQIYERCIFRIFRSTTFCMNKHLIKSCSVILVKEKRNSKSNPMNIPMNPSSKCHLLNKSQSLPWKCSQNAFFWHQNTNNQNVYWSKPKINKICNENSYRILNLNTYS